MSYTHEPQEHTSLLILCCPPHCCRQLPLNIWFSWQQSTFFCLAVWQLLRKTIFVCVLWHLDSQDYKDFLAFILSIIPSLWLVFFSISSEPFFFFFLQEMIIDKVNGQPVPRYLIYDIIKFNVSSPTKECIVSLQAILLISFILNQCHSEPGHSLVTLTQHWFCTRTLEVLRFSQDLY